MAVQKPTEALAAELKPVSDRDGPSPDGPAIDGFQPGQPPGKYVSARGGGGP